MKSVLLSVCIASSVAACATAAAPSNPTPPAAPRNTTTSDPANLPTALHWTRTAAEHRALFLQTYRAATDQLRSLVGNRTAGTWAVIMDADETVLDNSEYQRRLALRGERYAVPTWHAWIREIAADSLPGAAAFIRHVRELGGRIVIVTGREDEVCPETRENLRRLQLLVDVVLCQRPDERGKEERFRAVTAGTRTGLPALDVVMFIGDNIQDFPAATQQLRTAPATALEPFGRSWFLLPNPMYGSWERNPVR